MSTSLLRGYGSTIPAYGSSPTGACTDLDLARTDYPPVVPDNELAALLAGVDLRAGYPDAGPLAERIAQRFGVDRASVLITAGADDALARIARATLRPGFSAVLTAPTFEMLPRFVAQTGAQIRELPWLDGDLSLEALQDLVDETTALIAIVTPNNPTGMTVSTEMLCAIAGTFPTVTLLLDLAYVDFADCDPTSNVLKYSNVIVTRTFSKVWGLAALRLGYALGASAVINGLKTVGLPYAVSTPALATATALLGDDSASRRITARISRVRANRALLQESLASSGLQPIPSQGNYLAVRGPRAAWLADALQGCGIATRRMGTPATTLLRITVPVERLDFERLQTAIKVALAPEALLLDMDGVLADVSRSYREAIIRTAADFGVRVTREGIQQLKALGNANDDWQVTHRLIAAGGGSATLAETTTRFEQHYQGTLATPGFRNEESMVPTRQLLERLAERLPLAVVTGRPRGDAETFLAASGIGDLFRAVISRDDAPMKPHPAQLQRAMAILGVTRSWMVGDTPDDIRAARAASSIPLGIVAPGDDHTTAAPTLRAAGAARVLTSLEELLTCLP